MTETRNAALRWIAENRDALRGFNWELTPDISVPWPGALRCYLPGQTVRACPMSAACSPPEPVFPSGDGARRHNIPGEVAILIQRAADGFLDSDDDPLRAAILETCGVSP